MTLDIFLEQIIVYFISIYLLGAVYDDNISGKVNACDTRQGRDIGYQLKSGHGDQDNGGSCHGVAYGVCVRKTA